MATLWHPTARTPNLFLRPVSTDDFEPVSIVRRHPQAGKYLNMVDEAAAPAWFAARCWPHRFYFVVLLVDGSTPRESWPVIGSVGCSRGAPMVGYSLNPAYHGRGHGTEMLKGFLELYWRFVPSVRDAGEDVEEGEGGVSGSEVRKGVEEPWPELGAFDYVKAEVDANNIGSARVLEKNGFKVVGRRPKTEHELPRDGGDAVMYQLERPSESVE